MPRDFDWVALIDRKAAIREQFPTLRRLMSERPGCEAERQNRILLRRVMKEAGFRALPSEWWHFNFCSRDVARQKYKVIP